ncbi:MAG TPA: hypothetical protein VK131_12405, partial [Candidatus Acidoferrales bacterium]|nr:hypothetical protein [Candidatus Acidoferrales bacterium]
MSLVRLGVAGAVLFFTAYVFSWPVLWSGMQGSDLLWHLHLATWADGAFPWLPWWDRWDGGGIPYREAYPLLPHWIAIAFAHAFRLRLEQGIQLVEFLVNPLDALGIYVFLAWRRRRPLAGLVAGFLFLLSPIVWVGLFDFGLYANQVGTVFFMPCLIALDVLFQAWRRGDRSWRLRLAAGAFIGLAVLLGSVSHQLFPAPLIAALLYGAAAGRRAARWLLVVAPLCALAAVFLQLFWILPNLEFLAATGARTPRLLFSVSSL